MPLTDEEYKKRTKRLEQPYGLNTIFNSHFHLAGQLAGLAVGPMYERKRYLAHFLSYLIFEKLEEIKARLNIAGIRDQLFVINYATDATSGTFRAGLRYMEKAPFFTILERQDNTIEAEADASFLDVLERAAREHAEGVLVVDGGVVMESGQAGSA